MNGPRMKTIFESGTLKLVADRNRDEVKITCGEDGWVKACDAAAGAVALLRHLTLGYIGRETKVEPCE